MRAAPNALLAVTLWVSSSVADGQTRNQPNLPALIVNAHGLPGVSPHIPGNNTSFTREEIENSGAGSVAELLQNQAGIPSASFFGEPGLGTPILRGFAEGASSRTLILVDGVPVIRPDLSSTPWFQLPMGPLEQVDLLRGSRTVRYGTNALAGVLSLETARARDQFSGSLESAAGSDATFRNRAGITTPLGQWSMSGHVEDQRSDGYRDNSGYETNSLHLTFVSPAESPVEGRWTFSANDLEFENPGGLTKDQFKEDPRQSPYVEFGLADSFFNTEESLRATQALAWALAPDTELALNSSWQSRDRELNFGPGSHTDNDLETWFLEPVLTGGHGAITYELGLRATWDDLDLTRYRDIDRNQPFAFADLQRDLFGVFALASYQLNDEWQISGGAAWESYSLDARAEDTNSPNDPDLNFDRSGSDDSMAFEAALSYRNDDGLEFWTRYDRVYRFPAIDEIAAYQGFILTEPFNFDLEPERGHSVEIGMAMDMEDLRVSVTGYSLWLDGEIGYDFVENSNVNFARTHRLGLESSVTWEKDCWSLRLIHNLISAEYENGEFEGKRIPLVPKNTVSGIATWQPTDWLSLSLEGSYVSSSPEGNDFANTEDPLPSRTVFNTQFQWTPRENLAVYLRINNLFDKNYATLKYSGLWYPAAGRQFIAGARWKF